MAVIIDLKDIVWTIAVLLVGVIVFIAALFISVTQYFSSEDPASFSLRFIELNREPYNLLSVMSNLKNGERSVIEELLQASYVGIGNSQSPGLAGDIKNLFESYPGMDFYSVGIANAGSHDGKQTIVDSLKRCGPNNEGFCSRINPEIPLGRIGAEIIPGYCYEKIGSSVTQRSARICYKESRSADSVPSVLNMGKVEIVECGAGRAGVCASYCLEGRIRDSSSFECDSDSVNKGETPVCCIPSQAERAGLKNDAKIPLLYKDSSSVLEVTVE